MDLARYILILCTAISMAQTRTVTGTFAEAAGKDIMLKGYGFTELPILSQAVADTRGNFTLEYPQDYSGAALLEVRGLKSVILLLHHEDFSMEWSRMADFTTLKFKGSPENDAFNDGMSVYRDANAKKAALSYLAPLYASEPQKNQFMTTELQLQSGRMQQFLTALPSGSYVKYYLQLRILLSEIELSARNIAQIPLHEKEFNMLDFSNKRLERSGLYKDLFDRYFRLLESYGDAQYAHINQSTDAVLASLGNSPALKLDVAGYLFKLFESRSLFAASEHLALSMFADQRTVLDAERLSLFEQYRTMAIGKTAPDITLINSNKPFEKLSEIKSKYKLVVFGAASCPACVEEAPKLHAAYQGWKVRGVEIVYLSLDTDKASFDSFAGNFPWVSASDFKGWDGRAVRDYFVSGTPTMYLLGDLNKIVLKPISTEQIGAWLEVNK